MDDHIFVDTFLISHASVDIFPILYCLICLVSIKSDIWNMSLLAGLLLDGFCKDI
jgi:hypothetical protein